MANAKATLNNSDFLTITKGRLKFPDSTGAFQRKFVVVPNSFIA
jgi:hypothetical protein